MAIFRRNRREGDASAVERTPADRDLDEPDATESVDAPEAPDAPEPPDAPEAPDLPEPPADRAQGPFDVAEADDAERLDLGALRIVGTPGMHLQLELDEATQAVVSATVTVEGSAVQLQAFAAPRTSGIWAEIRQEIAAGIVTAGGTADVVDGPFGRELVGRMPGRGADGRTTFSPVRFLGIDGPRWFLRAVVTGDAAVDRGRSEGVLEVIRSVVVVRGSEAMAPRELLPLQLPSDAAAAPDAPLPEPGRSADDLRPFDRGPEITEVH